MAIPKAPVLIAREQCVVYLECYEVCFILLSIYYRDLFNAAFVSCWTQLSEGQQDELVTTIEQALNLQEIPEITQILLNLAEFMEHCDKVSIHFTQFNSSVFVLYSSVHHPLRGLFECASSFQRSI